MKSSKKNIIPRFASYTADIQVYDGSKIDGG